MHTIDCLHSASTSELTVICSGMATAPIAIDLETGASVTLRPACINTDMARFGVMHGGDAGPRPTGTWWADLPMAQDRTEARLALVTDGAVQNFTARWPEPEPEPAVKPKRLHRQGKIMALAGQAGSCP